MLLLLCQGNGPNTTGLGRQMRYYAKMTGTHPSGNKIFVEIWEAEPFDDDSTFDRMIYRKKFWRYSSAKKWAEKQIMKLVMKNKLEYFFIKDEDIIRREI